MKSTQIIKSFTTQTCRGKELNFSHVGPCRVKPVKLAFDILECGIYKMPEKPLARFTVKMLFVLQL